MNGLVVRDTIIIISGVNLLYKNKCIIIAFGIKKEEWGRGK